MMTKAAHKAMGNFFSSRAAKAESSDENSSVKTFHSSERWQLHYNNLKDSSKLVVIDFSASWCPPCRFMEPVIKDMAGKFTDVEFIKIDVDELPDVAQEFSVEAMPTFVLMKRGKESDRVVGADKDELEKKVEKHRATQS